ncbi:MAG: tetratricopeptide repeat protein [bacterium]|nr:tetratricopeptide repeat protein [bacterium]
MVTLGLLLCACSPWAPRGVERIAVIGVENLTGDASLDWMGIAIADIVAEQLLGLPTIHPRRLATRNDAVGWRATQVLSGYFTVSGESIDLRLVLDDRIRNSTVRALRAQRVPGELISLAGDIAREIGGPSIRPYGTASLPALQAYSEAFLLGDPAEVEAAMNRALEADPGYAQARIGLLQFAASRRDTESIASATADIGRFHPVDQAGVRVIEAMASGDRAVLLDALKKLAALTPADADLLERTANTFLASRNYTDAIKWYRAAADAEPSRTNNWNSLAYAQAWSGDLTAARSSLQRYRELDPADPNALDSLGEIHFHHGHFEEAARHFLECYDDNPSYRGGVALRKAGVARLLAEDRPGAEPLVEQFFNERQPTDVLEFHRIRWRYIAGDRAAATGQLAALATRESAAPVLASMAHSLLTVWLIDSGEREQATHHAEQARKLATNPQSQTWAALAEFLVQPPATPAEWEQRAAVAFPQPAMAAIRRNALATALLVSGHFAEAVPHLEEIAAAAPPYNEDEANVLLAWALIETGRAAEARPLIDVFPVVQPGQESLLYSLWFRRILELRAKLAGTH